MTDATHPVTQSALERFTRDYFNGLGASIQDNGDRWQVRLPTHVSVAFADSQELEVLLGERDTAKNDSAVVLSPESEFTQQLLDEAAEMATIGQLALTEDLIDGDHRYPSWITESDVSVVESSFNPYYDRTAVCVFVKIGLETVSEYQTQFLEAVTVDVESEQQLPGISEILIEGFFVPGESLSSGTTEYGVDESLGVSSTKLASAISAGQKAAVEAVRDKIAEVRQSASRSSDSEFEEYRQLQEQRINEIGNEINQLSDRLQDLTTDVDGAESQQKRVEALEKRRELKNDKEDLETELENILQEKKRGFAHKREKIYERHAIEITTKPVSSTLVAYERGEIELTVSEGDRTASIQAPYAIGAGVPDEIKCESCQSHLSAENPIVIPAGKIQCKDCS
ncbi:hypothetical protein [Haloarchaeobius sp. HRN-SO-5]|uniref:hypothetical protein n=1 Tax=Haloarchaeobius sp. HRN-SO-5 TaxID=3446118 RepID=UPI003EB7820A